MNLNFGQLLTKWRTGTKMISFCKELQDAILPKDPEQSPIITDYSSFQAWRERYNQRSLDTRRQIREKATLLAMGRIRTMAQKATPSTGRSKPSPTSDQLKRTGPAPRMNINEHSNMFRPGSRTLRKLSGAVKSIVSRPQGNYSFEGSLPVLLKIRP